VRKTVRWFLVFVLLFLLTGCAVSATQANIHLLTLKSKILKKNTSLYIYLPSDYATSTRRYPVLYLLHGAYGSYKDWVQKTSVDTLAKAYEMIIVFPDGSPFGWYVDSPSDSSYRYESYIVKELIPTIDSRYRTLTDRWHRGICGLSMGGHGAISLAEKHPDLFGSASSLSGILDITRHPNQWHIADRLGPYDKFPEQWRQNSCYFLAPRLIGADVKILFDDGRDDFAFPENLAFHERLDSLGVAHIFRVYPGTHNWQYWGAHIGEHLAFHNKVFLKGAPKRGFLGVRYLKEIGIILLFLLFYALYYWGKKESREVRQRRREVLERIKKNRLNR
jgi:S-formylglutathione hydrolase FrmB